MFARIYLKLNQLSLRQKVIGGILILVLLGGIGWGIGTGRINIKAMEIGQDFSDVATDSPNYWFIHAMKVNGITVGCPCTVNCPKYCPADNVLRSQMMQFLARAAKLDLTPFNPSDSSTAAAGFTDIAGNSAWKEIQAMTNEIGRTRNLLKNPGMETWTNGLPNDWLKINSTLTQEKSLIKEGTSSIKVVTSAPGTNGAMQIVKTLPAGIYTLSAWGKVVSGQNGGLMASNLGSKYSGPTDWRRFAFSFTLTSPQDVLIRVGGQANTTAYFDDIKLYRTDNLYCEGNKFCPGDNLKRDEMAGLLSWTLNLDISPFKTTDNTTWAANYTDTPTSNKYWSQIQAITQAGITTGCAVNPDKYCPAETVTREQMAIFLVRAFGLPLYTPPVITGQLTTLPNNAPLTNAVMTFDEDYIVVTDSTGNYTLDENMPPGLYELEIIKDSVIYFPTNSSGLVQIGEGAQPLNISGLRPMQDSDLQGT